MNYKKHIRRSFASDFSRDARAGNMMPQSSDLEIKLTDILIPEGQAQFCDYIGKCNKACFKQKQLNCGRARFYSKYPDYGIQQRSI